MKVEISAGQLEMIQKMEQDEREMLERVRQSCNERMCLVINSILAGKDMKEQYRVTGLSTEPPALEVELVNG